MSKIKYKKETYYTKPAENRGIYFFTSVCGNQMFCIEYNPLRYDNKLCPKCGRVLKFTDEWF